MSDRSADSVREKLRRLAEIMKNLASGSPRSFMTMSFLTLSPIPEIRITGRGILNAVDFRITNLFVRA